MLLLSIYGFSINYRGFRPKAHSSTLRAAKAQQFQERINFHLEHNFSNSEYNVELLSRDMRLSRSQLFRKCKQTLGQSPVNLIKHFRLEKSRKFLKTGIYNVSEAAYMAGFNSLSYYSKSFKKVYGETPSKWVV